MYKKADTPVTALVTIYLLAGSFMLTGCGGNEETTSEGKYSEDSQEPTADASIDIEDPYIERIQILQEELRTLERNYLDVREELSPEEQKEWFDKSRELARQIRELQSERRRHLAQQRQASAGKEGSISESDLVDAVQETLDRMEETRDNNQSSP